MKYSSEFLAQKAIMLRDHRCPQFTKVQLKMLFKMLDESLRGGPEMFVALGGGPKDPIFEGFVSGERQAIGGEEIEQYLRPFQYGTYHTHPAPWDYPIPPKSIEELKQFKREKKVLMHGPSTGDMLIAFTNSHQVLCVGGRQEAIMGGEAMIMCWTPPPLDLIDRWDMAIWKRVYNRRDKGKELHDCREEAGDIENKGNNLLYDAFWIVEEQKASEHPGQYADKLMEIEDRLKTIRHKKEAKLRECDKIRDEVIKEEKRLGRDLEDYWSSKDISPCLYIYPEYPTRVSSREEKEKYKEYKDFYGQDIETVPGGLCYEYTLKRALDAIVNDEDITIVHAKVQFWNDPPYEHAWVEKGGLVQDWQTMEAGASKFAGVGWDKNAFYDAFHPTNIRRYSPKEVVANSHKYGHMGPWY